MTCEKPCAGRPGAIGCTFQCSIVLSMVGDECIVKGSKSRGVAERGVSPLPQPMSIKCIEDFRCFLLRGMPPVSLQLKRDAVSVQRICLR